MDSSASNQIGASAFTGWSFPYIVAPYIKNTAVFLCPSAVRHVDPVGLCPNDVSCLAPTSTSAISYQMNGVVIRQSAPLPDATYAQAALKMSAITDTSGIILMQEWTDATNMATLRPRFVKPGYNYWHQVGAFQAGKEVQNSLHFDGGNILFCDGHAKWRKQTSIHAAEFGLSPDDPFDINNSGVGTNASSGTTYSALF